MKAFLQTNLKDTKLVMSSNNYKQVSVKIGSYRPTIDKQSFHKGFSNKHLVNKCVKVSLK